MSFCPCCGRLFAKRNGGYVYLRQGSYGSLRGLAEVDPISNQPCWRCLPHLSPATLQQQPLDQGDMFTTDCE